MKIRSQWMRQEPRTEATEQSAKIREVLNRCLTAIEARGAPASAAEIARRTGTADGQVRKILSQQRPLRPEFLRRLGEYAGLSVSELFVELGWLPEAEALGPFSATLARETQTALSALERARPHLELLARPPQTAPLTAADALLSDPVGARRFEVRLRQIVSGGRYLATTNAVGEFRLLEGERPLPLSEALAMAVAAGVRGIPTSEEIAIDPDYWRTNLELRARTCRALNTANEYSWQGEPGHRTWRSVAAQWPAHLLVQDTIAGLQQPAPAVPDGMRGAGPVVFIGGRHGTGLAAALLAQALGRQFVLVRENIDVTRHGHVVALPPDAQRHRTRAWISVAEHIEKRHAEGRPWNAIVLVRAAAFADAEGVRLDSYAAQLLSATTARLVYVHVPASYLYWWAARVDGDYRPGQRDGAAWASRMQSLYGQIEAVVTARHGSRDLLLQVPEPGADLIPHVPEIPAEVMDWTARVAWTVLRRTERPPGYGDLCPGWLANWQGMLVADPLATVPSRQSPSSSPPPL